MRNITKIISTVGGAMVWSVIAELSCAVMLRFVERNSETG
jgi:hypothetical protein